MVVILMNFPDGIIKIKSDKLRVVTMASDVWKHK